MSYLYHGSPTPFETVEPKQNIRYKDAVIFDQKSFHATPEKWIALSYTSNTRDKHLMKNNQYVYFSVGVDLYDNTHTVNIYGLESLEKSLESLYRNGGYVYTYDSANFYQTEGLGKMDYITTQAVDPINKEFIADPVTAMQELGVHFYFIDISSITDPKLLSLFLVTEDN